MISEQLDSLKDDINILGVAADDLLNSNAMFESEDFKYIMTHRSVQKDLELFRNRHPFVDVMLFPPLIRAYYASSANQLIDVDIPDGSEIMQISAPDNIYFYLSANKINFPLTSNAITSGDSPSQSFLVSPKNKFWVKGMRHLYLYIPNMGDVVSFSFWVDQ